MLYMTNDTNHYTQESKPSRITHTNANTNTNRHTQKTQTYMHLFFPRKLVNIHELMHASTYEDIQGQRKIEAPEATAAHNPTITNAKGNEIKKKHVNKAHEENGERRIKDEKPTTKKFRAGGENNLRNK